MGQRLYNNSLRIFRSWRGVCQVQKPLGCSLFRVSQLVLTEEPVLGGRGCLFFFEDIILCRLLTYCYVIDPNSEFDFHPASKIPLPVTPLQAHQVLVRIRFLLSHLNPYFGLLLDVFHLKTSHVHLIKTLPKLGKMLSETKIHLTKQAIPFSHERN